MLGIEADTITTVALVALAVLVVLMVVAIKVLTSVMQKVIALVVLAALGLAVWTQRASVQDCADGVKEAVSSADRQAVCSFFGFDVDVDVPGR